MLERGSQVEEGQLSRRKRPVEPGEVRRAVPLYSQ